jgi:hypothetical protein
MKQRLLFDYLISSLSSDMHASHLSTPRFVEERRPRELWKQKVFCVLSSQFSANRAASISDLMLKDVPFFDGSLALHRIEET